MDETTHCSTKACTGFNYCLVAKIIVGIAAIPMIGAVVASFINDPEWQFTVATYSGAIVVLAAQKIDRMASLSRMVLARK